MLNKKLSFLAILAAVLFAACGEDVVQNRIGISEMLAVESVSALPECSAENEGEVARVSGELSTFVCTGEKWARTVEDVVVSPELSCASEPLADNSGVKIVCNGDSVAVLKNGKDGEQGLQGKKGEDAAGCSYKYYGKDETLVVTCGETSVTIDLEKKIEEESSSSAPVSSSDVIPVSSSSDVVASSATEESSSSVDEEAIPTSLDSLSGLSQKGPFTKGSTVELYELSDGRTLRQTNGNFLGSIDSDDGFFRINSRNLVSQYAMLVATGTYRNEVTGTTEDAKLALQAITDLTSRSTANVNLLTHLEFARVQYLVTEKKMKVKDAKRQALAEILNAFHIDTTGVKNSEDLSVFGNGNGNAALLAISVLLQGHRSVSELTELLAKISLDFKEDGSWDDAKIRAEVADWAEFWDLADELEAVRKFVKAWNLGVVPEFEVYVRNFYVKEYQIESECNASNKGKTVQNMNAFSSKKGKQYVCDGSRWIYGFKDARDGRYYRMVNIGDQVWMAENLKYEYQIKKASKDSLLSWSLKMLDKYSSYDTSDIKMREGFVYSWAAAMDSAALFSEDGKGCGRFAECTPAETVRGVCPEGWHLPSEEEFTVLAEYVGYATGKLQYYGTEVYKSYLVGTNELGFSAIGASCKVELFMGNFDDCELMFNESGWWSSTATREFSGPRASWKEYEEKEPTVFYIGGSLITIAAWYIKEDGLSVRCIKDSE